jgi:excisionase family DNA binding protein
MIDRPFLSTKEVARFLDVNEKMVYSLVSDKGLPATKITGKWLFPRRLVEQWLENHIINYPKSARIPSSQGVLIIVGSHDVLMEKAIGLFNQLYPDHLAVFGNIGSLGGLKTLSQGFCHIAASHLLQDDEGGYNFDFAQQELGSQLATVVNFSRREQGILVAKGNPKTIQGISDFKRSEVILANRPVGTGTRLLLDRELQKIGLSGTQIKGYEKEFRSHWDVALEVLAGRADVAVAIKAVADLCDLDFIPLRWERYDLLIPKNRFFEEGVQLFLNLLREKALKDLAQELKGYDLTTCGKMIFPPEAESRKGREKKGNLKKNP